MIQSSSSELVYAKPSKLLTGFSIVDGPSALSNFNDACSLSLGFDSDLRSVEALRARLGLFPSDWLENL